MQEVHFNGFTARSCATDDCGVITATIDVERDDGDSAVYSHDVSPGQTFDTLQEAKALATEKLVQLKGIDDAGELIF
ncbi:MULTISPECIES: hypothetical protein [Halomonadaceae]|uniref:hypothetical protein n=1 Tax=Halomonadaceae TaxID=28256 RepID=UPI001597DAC0|nr:MULTISPECIES: hypothetical protein [Halomonas]QJQ96759.1 hypothetical protein HIO72_16720 [Halomonas sp. PA5]